VTVVTVVLRLSLGVTVQGPGARPGGGRDLDYHPSQPEHDSVLAANSLSEAAGAAAPPADCRELNLCLSVCYSSKKFHGGGGGGAETVTPPPRRDTCKRKNFSRMAAKSGPHSKVC
jgi:hypothetical protein